MHPSLPQAALGVGARWALGARRLRGASQSDAKYPEVSQPTRASIVECAKGFKGGAGDRMDLARAYLRQIRKVKPVYRLNTGGGAAKYGEIVGQAF